MKLATQKILGWVGLAIGLGGAGTFFVLCLDGPPPRNSWWWSWPVITVLLAVGSALYLRRTYRRAPPAGKGYCHLRLSDLLIIVFFCGLVMAAGQEDGYERSLWVAVALAFCFGTVLTIGFVLAEAMALSSWQRYAFSFGLIPLSLGALSWGAFLVLTVASVIGGGPGEALAFACGFLTGGHGGHLPSSFAVVLRIGLCLLPPGILTCWLALHRRPKTEPGVPATHVAAREEPRDRPSPEQLEP